MSRVKSLVDYLYKRHVASERSVHTDLKYSKPLTWLNVHIKCRVHVRDEASGVGRTILDCHGNVDPEYAARQERVQFATYHLISYLIMSDVRQKIIIKV